jgi:hypothetical protein
VRRVGTTRKEAASWAVMATSVPPVRVSTHVYFLRCVSESFL